MNTVVLVGAGALGSHVAPLLRNAEGLVLHIVDFDKVETKNTLSQFYGQPAVTRSKASALMSQLRSLWPTMKIEAKPVKLTTQNSEVLLGRATLVIDCLDNAEGRQAIQREVRKRGVPCLHGAVSADGAYGVSVWDEHFVIDTEGSVGQATCEGGEHLAFINVVSAVLATSATRFLRDGTKDSFRVWSNGVKLW